MIISNIIEPIIQDIIEPINGSEDVFALILDGAPVYDTTVTKVGDSFGSGPTGDIITFGADEAAYTYINGQKVFLQYSSRNIIPYSSDQTKWLLGNGATYNNLTNEFTIPQTGFVRFTGGPTTDYQNEDWTHYINVLSASAIYEVAIYDGVLNIAQNHTDTGLKDTAGTMDASATAMNAFVRNNEATDLVISIDFAQLNPGLYIAPKVLTNGTAVTVNASTQSLLVEDVGAEKAVLPWYSDVGTPFGLKGLFGGVDGNPAFGQGGIITHTVYDLSIDIVLGMFELNSFIVWWIEAITGFIKMTDGVNTCVSDTAVVAGTPFTAYPRWDGVNAKMWITKDDSKGLEEQFDGFPAMGDRFFGIIDIYQTNRQFSFNQQIDFAYVYDGDDLVIDAGLPVIDYL